MYKHLHLFLFYPHSLLGLHYMFLFHFVVWGEGLVLVLFVKFQVFSFLNDVVCVFSFLFFKGNNKYIFPMVLFHVNKISVVTSKYDNNNYIYIDVVVYHIIIMKCASRHNIYDDCNL